MTIINNPANNISAGISGQVLVSGSISGGPAGYASLNASSTISGQQQMSGAYKIAGNCEISGDLKVDGVSIKDQLAKINERLAILVPDPVLLEKYEALQNLYSQYKTLEALCK